MMLSPEAEQQGVDGSIQAITDQLQAEEDRILANAPFINRNELRRIVSQGRPTQLSDLGVGVNPTVPVDGVTPAVNGRSSYLGVGRSSRELAPARSSRESFRG